MAQGKMQPRNLGHRGASAHAPENTLRAFRLAEQLGADGIEFDVQLTKDGVPVVIHDEQLKRTTGANGYVIEHTLEEIKRLDAGSWFSREYAGDQIPTLEEVIREFAGRMYLNIELKNSNFDMPCLEQNTIELIRRYGIEQQAIVSSFHHGSMQRFHQLAPDIPTGLLYDCVIVGAADYAKALGAAAIHPFFGTIKPEIVQDAHTKGLQVNVWTVNDAEHMRLLLHAGVDAIITNYPERLRDVLTEALGK